ncbi:MAG: hypothetical protein K6B72_10410 [Lachnospiraceae bacterium]|nr:hypothetical protein [Lachnospiraceae bacterium]
MKKSTILLVVLLLVLAGCGGQTNSAVKENKKETVQEKTDKKKNKEKTEDNKSEGDTDSAKKSAGIPEIWTATEMPVHLDYARMWEYGAYGETDDPELIAEAVDAIRAIRIGEPTDMCVDDYSDYLTFTFEDGSEVSLSFEEHIWVVDRETRYRVDGLKNLRAILDPLIGEE